MSNASPWAGLGSLNLRKSPAAAPLPAATGDEEEDDFERPSVQRIVSATPASPFDLPFIKTPAARAAAPHPKEKPHMATQRAKPAHPVARDLQRRVGLALLEAESLSRDELAAQFSDLNSKRLAQTMFNMNTAKRARRVNTAEGQVWQLTPLGRKWMQEGGVSPRGPKPAATTEPAKPAKPKRAKPGKQMKKACSAMARSTWPRTARPSTSPRPNSPRR